MGIWLSLSHTLWQIYLSSKVHHHVVFIPSSLTHKNWCDSQKATRLSSSRRPLSLILTKITHPEGGRGFCRHFPAAVAVFQPMLCFPSSSALSSTRSVENLPYFRRGCSYIIWEQGITPMGTAHIISTHLQVYMYSVCTCIIFRLTH